MQKKALVGIAAIRAYFDDIKRSNTSDYLVNSKNYARMVDLIQYCQHLEKQYDCEIRRCVFNPAWADGCVEMIFHCEWAVEPDALRDLTKTLVKCDGINIASYPVEDNWIQVSFFISNLWTKNTTISKSLTPIKA